ncbi:MAG TPA: helix-hairpin-helix domain-containing protein [Ilumatobacteraceae bacterium]|nr:helix-hairpin-helix domain-containing protein [Ilumatobacteraceae bacterium]
MSTRHRNVEGSDLQTLVNVGPAVARRFERVGITRTGQLIGRDPVALYEEMCEAAGQREDLCLLDTVMSAVDQADGGLARPWWEHTEYRKRLLAKRDGESRDSQRTQ